MRFLLVLLAVFLAPSLALAHPGHGPYTGPHDFNPGAVGVVFGLTLGAAIAAWEKWGKQWEAGRKYATVGAGEPEPEPEPDTERTSLAATLGRHLMAMSLEQRKRHMVHTDESSALLPNNELTPIPPLAERCTTCGETPDVEALEDEPEECQGHPAGPFDPMGQTVYCDGSCRTEGK